MKRRRITGSYWSSIVWREGIGPSHAEKLGAAGITTVEGLLEAGATSHRRNALEEKTGITHHHLLTLVNQADLFRVQGIGRQYAELQRAAGVDSVLELVSCPRYKRYFVAIKWVEQSQVLPGIVQYRSGRVAIHPGTNTKIRLHYTN
jgi:hypothetical protein